MATEPRHFVTADGLQITSFRLASPQWHYGRTAEKCAAGASNWFTVTAFRALATNTARCVSKSERVIVTGTLRTREWETDGRTGTTIELEAEAIGHDLSFGTTIFCRSLEMQAPDVSVDPAV